MQVLFIVDFFIQYKEAKLLHSMYLNDQDDMNLLQQAMGKYNTASRNLSSLLIKHYIRYDIPSIVIGIILGLVVCTFRITSSISLTSNFNIYISITIFLFLLLNIRNHSDLNVFQLQMLLCIN